MSVSDAGGLDDRRNATTEWSGTSVVVSCTDDEVQKGGEERGQRSGGLGRGRAWELAQQGNVQFPTGTGQAQIVMSQGYEHRPN